MNQCLLRLSTLGICLFAAGCQPSTAAVGSSVQALLQSRLAETFGAGNASVTNVAVVREVGNKYQGVANISAFGGTTTLKIAIVADGSNVLYDVAGPDWAALVTSVRLQRIGGIRDEYSDIVVKNDQFLSVFPRPLQEVKAKFALHLATVVPVTKEGIYLFGSGCMAHECGSEEAAWAIDENQAVGYAVILTNGVAGPTFSVYGAAPEHLPTPLLAWALEKGMTGMNVAVIRPRDEGAK